jgi:hypothetical protein
MMATGYVEGIGFLLAMKALVRYPEIKEDANSSELIIWNHHVNTPRGPAIAHVSLRWTLRVNSLENTHDN